MMHRFWKTIPLDQISANQWEALCDGCGRCCLQKFVKSTTGKVYYTWVACHLLDTQTCRCTDYDLRHVLVPDCLKIEPANICDLRWLPRTCAYRMVAAGEDLLPWHPLISGNPMSVHQAGISVMDRAVSEVCVHPDDVEKYIIPRDRQSSVYATLFY